MVAETPIAASGIRGLEAPAAPDLLTPEEVAAILRVGKSAVYDLCKANQIVHLRIGANGGRIRIQRSEVTAYLERARQQATLQPVAVPIPTAARKRAARRPVGFVKLRAAGYRG